MEVAIQTALTKYPGEVISADVDTEEGAPVWNLTLVGKDGKSHDVTISGRVAKVLSVDGNDLTGSADASGNGGSRVKSTGKTAGQQRPGLIRRRRKP